MFQNLLKLMVPLSKYNVLKIKVIFLYFKQEYVIGLSVCICMGASFGTYIANMLVNLKWMAKVKRRIWRLPYKANNEIIHNLSYNISLIQEC